MLLALDVDGTTLSPTGRVTPRTIDALNRVREGGVACALATGRTWWESRGPIEAIGLSGPGVFATGASIREQESGDSIASVHLNGEIIRQVAATIESLGLPALVLGDIGVGAPEYIVTEGADLPSSLIQWIEYHRVDIVRATDIATREWPAAIRIGTVAEPLAVERVTRVLTEKFADSCVHHMINLPAYNVNVLEIFSPKATKWSGVQKVARHLKIDERNTIAFGDDVNDVTMLLNAGLGIAMGNASSPAIAVAKAKTKTNAEDGLAHALELLIECDFDLTRLKDQLKKAA
ncbi:MAG TPA: HAD-IIB family hydrolase [Tepidisphaeraceae bacterium]|nr:HAD-IIB family hydrolase [Tepidisphaeraceae bacterium]